jgi:hypothetical protein
LPDRWSDQVRNWHQADSLAGLDDVGSCPHS